MTAPDTAAHVSADLAYLIDGFSDGILFMDREWRITFANESARQISRIEPRHLNGPTHWEIYPATVGTQLETTYRRTMDERVSLDHEWYYPLFDVWISLRTTPIPTGIAVTYRDVSRLKKAEATRDETARQLQQVFEATTDAVVVLDAEYRITFMNPRANELLSPFGEVMGMVLFDALPGTVYPDSPYERVYRKAMEDRTPGEFLAFYPEPMNQWLQVEAYPADNGIIIFFRDVSGERSRSDELQRKTAEAERQAAEIETVYRNAPIGLALFDVEDFRYLRLNDRQAAFFGLKPEEIVGRTVTEMAPIEGLRELFEGVRDGASVVNFPLEGELVSSPGEHRYWTVNYTPVIGPDGAVQAIAAASLEITAQKKAENALIQSEKLAAVGRLASSISHEINNPLESITNLLYLIQMNQHLPSEVRTFVDLTQQEVARVSQIATQTLRFHRQAVRPTRVTAAQLLEPIVKLYQGRLSNSGIHMREEFVSATPILCLENEIRQVLSNLIANAVDAMKMGGRLVLRSHDAHINGIPGVRITIADTGHGMSGKTMARIFEPFFTTKELNGTGLGLWISAEIVQRHKGKLSVRSSELPIRHGTVFSLFLPVESLT